MRGQAASARKYRCWHFVKADRTLGYDAESLTVEAGYIYSIGKNETPRLCFCGMHGSIRPIDALKYAPGPVACLVDVYGDVKIDADKLVGRHRHVLAVVDATILLHRFVCWCVRNTPLSDGRTVWDLLTDERNRRAVETKERWIDGKATDGELAAARDAAWDAAWDAAAWDAARAAAAWDAARDAQNKQLEAMLMAEIEAAR